jgi:hypothetical protein
VGFRLIAAALCVAGMGGAATVAQERHVPPGTWGGEHLALTVTDDGATLEFDCAAGKIATPLVTDTDGRIVAAGDYTPEQPGRVRPDEPPASRGAQYTGQLTGDTLVLSVALAESKETLGPFTVVKDAPARLHKCR